MRGRPFCSDAARARVDDNMATATRIDVWILVELAKTWGRRPLIDASLPAPVEAALTRAIAEIPRSRVVFIRRRLEVRSGCRVYIARSAPTAWITTIDLPSLDEVADLPFRALSEGRGQSAEGSGETTDLLPSDTPLVLVCTHGQRDSCCGRRGFPLYDALRTQTSLDVWQCSHIGGDRFAANAVVLPWGLYYGPVEPRDAGALADSVLRGEILIDAYRGRSSMPRTAQAAETFVRRTTGMKSRDALRVTARKTLPDGRIHVHLRDDTGTLHEVTFEPYVSTAEAHLTCTAESTCPIVQFRLVDYRTTNQHQADQGSSNAPRS
jgi:hypothetical protein